MVTGPAAGAFLKARRRGPGDRRTLYCLARPDWPRKAVVSLFTMRRTDVTLTSQLKTNLKSLRESHLMYVILGFMKDEARAICGWAVVIGAALIGFWLSEGTAYHQLVVGLLLSSVSLFVALSLIEALWRSPNDQPPR